MKELALIGSNGPVFAQVLSRLLEEGRSVTAYTTAPTKIMLDNTRLTVERFDTTSKEAIRKELSGYDSVIVAYETDFTDAANNDFILRTYPDTVNAAIEAGVRRLIVVGNKDSEAYLSGELKRHADGIDARYISTEGCYARHAAEAVR